MLRAYKYRIYPTDEQQVMLAKTFGCCRFVQNWALGLRKDAYEKEKVSIPYRDLQDKLVHELKEEKEWLKEVSSQALLNALKNHETAFRNFFRDPKVGYPKFRSRKGRQSFQCPQHCSVDFSSGTISIPKVNGIPAKLHRKFVGNVKTVTVSKEPSGKYFASVLVDTGIKEPLPPERNAENTVGMDMGVETLVVCSDGREFQNHRYLKKSLDKIVSLQKSLARKQPGSANREKARVRLARAYEHVTNQRKDTLHKITYRLTHDSQVKTCCMEDLNVKGLSRNHHLASSILDAGFGMFADMLEYKCRWYGVNFVKIDRFAPSSKTCSHCGYVYKDLKLNQREWTCACCGTRHNRDFNAAVNIKKLGISCPTLGARESHALEDPTVDDRHRPKKQWSGESGKVRAMQSDAPVFRRV